MAYNSQPGGSAPQDCTAFHPTSNPPETAAVARWHARRLQRLFTRHDDGWGPREPIAAGLPLFAAPGLRVSWTRLPLEVCEQAQRVPKGKARARESLEHQILKRAALLWMRSEYAADAREETDCLVGRADVFSASRAWIAECGKTGVSKLVAAVASGEAIRFSLIPYQWATWDDETTVRRLIAVEFSWTPEFGQNVAQAARDADARFSAEQTGPGASTKVGTVWTASLPLTGEA